MNWSTPLQIAYFSLHQLTANLLVKKFRAFKKPEECHNRTTVTIISNFVPDGIPVRTNLSSRNVVFWDETPYGLIIVSYVSKQTSVYSIMTVEPDVVCIATVVLTSNLTQFLPLFRSGPISLK